MKNPLYGYSPIIARPRFTWPGGARLAFYLGVNIEHYRLDRPSMSIFGGTAALVPDPLNYGWRDYGPRVGFWRLLATLDTLEMPASVLLNAACCEEYPAIIDAGRERGWAWLAHGHDNSTLQSGMDEAAERAYLTAVVETIAQATGHPVRGWLGPALTETFATPRLLRELGLTYVLDWCCDDQPFRLQVPGMLSVPYSIEVNDVTLFVSKSVSGPEFVRTVCDQFDQLYADAQYGARVMALAIHPFIVNQPFRHKYLAEALAYICSHDDVWITTSDAIAEHYLQQTTSDPTAADRDTSAAGS